jgi:SAM-dependent methyltransferase
MTFTSTRFGQFTYFSTQLGDTNWSGKNVLDFGGNIGNILLDPNSTIDPERYWCLDVDKDSVEQGRASFPNSHWLFYDRFSFFFNPNGIRSLPLPRMEETFTYIVAFSVFTNTSETDMLELVEDLKSKLKPGGALAFTFIDPYYVTWGARAVETICSGASISKQNAATSPKRKQTMSTPERKTQRGSFS